MGGIGTVSGTILGIILLAVLENDDALVGVSSYSFGIVTGLVILLSVSATAYSAKRQQSAEPTMSPENSPNLQRKERPAPMHLIAGDPTITLLIGFIALAIILLGCFLLAVFFHGHCEVHGLQMPELGILFLAMMVPLISG